MEEKQNNKEIKVRLHYIDSGNCTGVWKVKTENSTIFPENDDALYRVMTTYMPRYYFPSSLSEDGIHEFAGKEFCCLRDIVCREYHFDEDKYIAENGGESPFDFVCDDIEREVYRRIRKDDILLGIISVRKLLIEKIRRAVEKENNIIGTFYQNRGAHYRESGSLEYETSPIVVVHNPVFYGYGGYESATVYELFIDGNGKLLCTLNGEAGEDFDEPVEHVQIEGLFEIIHWLEEYGFITTNHSYGDIIVCEECGSIQVQQRAWIHPNCSTNGYVGEIGNDRDDNWCEECEEHNCFCTLYEFKKNMQEWWEELELTEMECITGFHQVNFSPKNDNQDFVATCNKWWREKDYDTQRNIWKKHN